MDFCGQFGHETHSNMPANFHMCVQSNGWSPLLKWKTPNGLWCSGTQKAILCSRYIRNCAQTSDECDQPIRGMHVARWRLSGMRWFWSAHFYSLIFFPCGHANILCARLYPVAVGLANQMFHGSSSISIPPIDCDKFRTNSPFPCPSKRKENLMNIYGRPSPKCPIFRCTSINIQIASTDNTNTWPEFLIKISSHPRPHSCRNPRVSSHALLNSSLSVQGEYQGDSHPGIRSDDSFVSFSGTCSQVVSGWGSWRSRSARNNTDSDRLTFRTVCSRSARNNSCSWPELRRKVWKFERRVNISQISRRYPKATQTACYEVLHFTPVSAPISWSSLINSVNFKHSITIWYL
jgi:hypothetical protein